MYATSDSAAVDLAVGKYLKLYKFLAAEQPLMYMDMFLQEEQQ